MKKLFLFYLPKDFFFLTNASSEALNASIEGISMSRRVEIREKRDRDTLRSVMRRLNPWMHGSLNGLIR